MQMISFFMLKKINKRYFSNQPSLDFYIKCIVIMNIVFPFASWVIVHIDDGEEESWKRMKVDWERSL